MVAQGAGLASSGVANGAITGPKISAVVETRVTGSSSSGTATTLICQIVAAAGNRLVGISVDGDQAAAANTQMKLIVTYVDTTTASLTLAANAVIQLHASGAGAIAFSATNSARQAFDTAQAITAVRLETAGTGVGLRTGYIQAWEVSP